MLRVHYEVEVEVPARLAPAFMEYMTSRHITEVVGTGCFRGAVLATAGEGRFRTSYEADRREDVERYVREHAARLREDFATRFPEGLRVEREVWVDLHREVR